MTLNPPLARQHIAWCITFVHPLDTEALTELTGYAGRALEEWTISRDRPVLYAGVGRWGLVADGADHARREAAVSDCSVEAERRA